MIGRVDTIDLTISTWSETPGEERARVLEHVTLTAYKVAHLESYIREIDMDAWTKDITMLKKQNN